MLKTIMDTVAEEIQEINMAVTDKDPQRIEADKIRLEFMQQSDLDLIHWKAEFSQPGFITITEHIKAKAKSYLDRLPF